MFERENRQVETIFRVYMLVKSTRVLHHTTIKNKQVYRVYLSNLLSQFLLFVLNSCYLYYITIQDETIDRINLPSLPGQLVLSLQYTF